eukprot:3743112-Pyramimonas_sp.AAC.1
MPGDPEENATDHAGPPFRQPDFEADADAPYDPRGHAAGMEEEEEEELIQEPRLGGRVTMQ